MNRPADRFVIAQSWWVAAELVRRNPALVLRQTSRSFGEHDDSLALFLPSFSAKVALIELDRDGSMQVIGPTGGSVVESIAWADCFARSDPSWAVKRLERAAGLAGAAPQIIDPAALAYGFIACVLTGLVNDSHTWDCRSELLDTEEDLGPAPTEAGTDWTGPEGSIPMAPCWAVVRGPRPVAMVYADGRLHARRRSFDLNKLYRAYEQRMSRLVARTMRGLLP